MHSLFIKWAEIFGIFYTFIFINSIFYKASLLNIDRATNVLRFLPFWIQNSGFWVFFLLIFWRILWELAHVNESWPEDIVVIHSINIANVMNLLDRLKSIDLFIEIEFRPLPWIYIYWYGSIHLAGYFTYNETIMHQMVSLEQSSWPN